MSVKIITNSLFKKLKVIRELIRWDHWYESKIPLFFIIGYTLLILHGLDVISFLNYIRLILFSIFFLAFGYALNDYCDQEYDLQVGKPNAIATLSSTRAILFLVLLFISGWLCLPFKNPLSISLASLAYSSMAFYSLPPLRLKERGLLGLITASIAQRTLPGLLFFEAFQHWTIDAFLFSLLYLFIGLRWIIAHQIWDYENDLRSGVRTYATQVGKDRLQCWLEWVVFPIELALSASLIVYYFKPLPWLVFLFGGCLVLFWLSSRYRSQSSFMQSLFTSEWIPLADFYFIIWPLSLALYLALEQPLFWIVFFLNILWEHWLIILQIQGYWKIASKQFLLR
jgi:4-hydroxybenzoate polyprenyltransferase